MPERRVFPRSAALGLAVVASACTTVVDGSGEVVGQQIDGVWVFTYAETPSSSNDALGSGQAAIVDDCLRMGDAVVIWRDHHLDAVDEVVARVLDGEVLHLQVGGGGLSLEEGSTVDDFPAAVVEHCSPSEIWFSGDGELAIEEGA